MTCSIIDNEQEEISKAAAPTENDTQGYCSFLMLFYFNAFLCIYTTNYDRMNTNLFISKVINYYFEHLPYTVYRKQFLAQPSLRAAYYSLSLTVVHNHIQAIFEDAVPSRKCWISYSTYGAS